MDENVKSAQSGQLAEILEYVKYKKTSMLRTGLLQAIKNMPKDLKKRGNGLQTTLFKAFCNDFKTTILDAD